MVSARLLVRIYLVKHDLVYDHGVYGLDGCHLDGFVGDGVSCYCYSDGYEEDLVVVKLFLQRVGSSCAIVVPY